MPPEPELAVGRVVLIVELRLADVSLVEELSSVEIAAPVPVGAGATAGTNVPDPVSNSLR